MRRAHVDSVLLLIVPRHSDVCQQPAREARGGRERQDRPRGTSRTCADGLHRRHNEGRPGITPDAQSARRRRRQARTFKRCGTHDRAVLADGVGTPCPALGAPLDQQWPARYGDRPKRRPSMCLWASDSKPWSSCGRHERSAQHAYKPIRRRKVVHSWGELIKTSHMTNGAPPQPDERCGGDVTAAPTGAGGGSRRAIVGSGRA